MQRPICPRSSQLKFGSTKMIDIACIDHFALNGVEQFPLQLAETTSGLTTIHGVTTSGITTIHVVIVSCVTIHGITTSGVTTSGVMEVTRLK